MAGRIFCGAGASLCKPNQSTFSSLNSCQFSYNKFIRVEVRLYYPRILL